MSINGVSPEAGEAGGHDRGIFDLVILGDSHGLALAAAAKAQGLRSEMLYLSGNFWHENRMRPDPRLGLSARYRPVLQRRIIRFSRVLGGNVFPEGVPILVSLGYHLGRLAPLLARHGHSPFEDGEIYVSERFLQTYLRHHRAALHRLLRLNARGRDLVVVAPPLVQVDPLARALADRLTVMLQAQGLRVFDPAAEPDWAGQPLPDHLRSPDQVHGNAAYGQEVLARLQARGWLRLPPQLDAASSRVKPGRHSTSPMPFSLATRLATNSQSDNRLR